MKYGKCLIAPSSIAIATSQKPRSLSKFITHWVLSATGWHTETGTR